ncbi:MAG: hypothetical protein ACK4UY_15785 [Dietzia sp.]
MTNGPEHPEAIERIRAAVASVKSDVRGLSQADAEGRLVSALRQHDAFLSRASVRVLARDLRDPWWARRHPVKAFRQTRQLFAEPDLESGGSEAEADELSRRLREFQGVEGVSSRRTMDGMEHVVTIDPWSDELADRVRHAAAPTEVIVRPV